MCGTTKYLANVGNVLGKKQPEENLGYHFVLLAKYFVVPYISGCPQARYGRFATRRFTRFFLSDPRE